MRKKFTPRARHVMFFAQEEAARLGTNDIGTEHLLLALIREKEGTGAKALERSGASLGSIRQEVFAQVPLSQQKASYDFQLTGPAKSAIDLARKEVESMENERIGTEHILIGLTEERGGLASKILTTKFKLKPDRLRETVMQIQGELSKAAVHEPSAAKTDFVYAVFPVSIPKALASLEQIASHVEAEVVAKASQGWELLSAAPSPESKTPGALIFMKKKVR
jgi:ATP-dependent Clp protease ATP-binding subunit ClpA